MLSKLRISPSEFCIPFCIDFTAHKPQTQRISRPLICTNQVAGDGKSGLSIENNGFRKWVRQNEELARLAPTLFGGASYVLILLNRSFSGIAPVADASSAQSRADVIALALATTMVLTGLVWISIKPKQLTPVPLVGVECLRLWKSLPASIESEIMWVWKSVRKTTCCEALMIIYQGCCVLQAGLASESNGEAKTVNTTKLLEGSLCQTAISSGKQSYLANLSLYPGRFELDFLPENTQSVILQPLGDDGIMIVAGNTVRGFGFTDQGWISSVGDKLDATLGKNNTITTKSTNAINP